MSNNSSPKPKMTTGGFFRRLLSHAITGEGENPVETVIKEGLKANGSKEAKAQVIEAEGQEVPSQGGDSDVRGTASPPQTPKT